MDEILVVGILVLGVLATVWSTLFALLQYQNDRLDELDAAIETVVFEDVQTEFLQPKLAERLARWATLSPQAPPGSETAVGVFCDLRERLLLDAADLQVYVTLCTERTRAMYRFHSKRYIRQRVEALCRQYVWRTDVLDRMIRDLIDLCVDGPRLS